MAITPLPTAPSRSDPPDVFSSRSDAWVAALPPWTDEVNALAVDVDADATSASSSAASASSDASDAAASAASALAAPGTNATSTNSVTIGLGSKAFTVETGKDFVIGMIMIAVDDAAPTTNTMTGGVTSYNPGTGALVLDIVDITGSGTISAWTISISGRAGLDGGSNIVLDTTPQFGGPVDGQDFEVSKINLKDYGELTNAIGSIGGGTQDIDLTLGNSVSATVDTSTTTFTFSNPTETGKTCTLTLTLVNGGSQTVIWPTSVAWPSEVPTLTTDGVDILIFVTIDGGVIWRNLSVLSFPAGPGFDLSTLSAVQVTKSVTTEDTAPTGIAFNNDGSKVFMVGQNNDSIYEYNLTALFDLSTISAVQVTKSVTSEDTSPQGIAFNNTGSKIFMVGDTNDSIYEYNLTTPFDLSTLSTVQVTKSITSEDTIPQGIVFNDTGSKIFMVGNANDSVYEYNLTTPYDLSTLSAVQVTKSVASEDITPAGIAFNKTGNKLFMVGGDNDSIYEYDLTTSFDLSTLSAVQVTKSVTTEDTFPKGIAFKNDGSKIFMIGSANDSIYEYDLIFIGYDLNNLSTVQVTKSVATEDTAPTGIAFNNDGSKVFMTGFGNASIYEYNLTTPYDLSTLSAVQVTKSVTSEDVNPFGIVFNDTGSKIFMVGNANASIYEYNLSTPYDLSTLSAVQVTKSVTSEDVAPRGIAFNDTGSKIFMVGIGNDSIYEYNLSIPYDLSTLSAVQVTKSVTSEDAGPSGIAFNDTGSKIFMVGVGNDSIYEYNLSTPYDLSTLSAVQVTKSVTTEDTTPQGIVFNDTGSKIFMVGQDNDSIHEYNL